MSARGKVCLRGREAKECRGSGDADQICSEEVDLVMGDGCERKRADGRSRYR